MVDRIADPWGPRTPYGPDASDGEAASWPVRVDTFLAEGVREADVERWVRSASVLHSNGDAFEFAVRDGEITGVRGTATDRVNHGRLGPKDLFGWQAIGAGDRLRRPLVREGETLREVDWATAMQRVVDRSRELLEEPGGWGRFGFYTSGQLALEEYYTLAVIGKAGIGTPHMDGNTRLCTATSAAALKASFGTDGQPGSYTDVDHCDAIALWGHNVAETQTVLWARMLDRRRGPRPPRMLVGGPSAHAGRPGGGCPSRPATRYQRRAAQRVAPRDPASRLVRRGVRRRPHDRLRAARRHRRSVCPTSGWPRSATSRRHRSPRPPSASVRATACCRPCCRASTRRIRPRRPLAS